MALYGADDAELRHGLVVGFSYIVLGDLDIAHGHLGRFVSKQFHQGRHGHPGAGHLRGEGVAKTVAGDMLGGVEMRSQVSDVNAEALRGEMSSPMIDHHQVPA